MVTATRPSANGHLAGPTPLHAILPQTKTTPRQPKTASQQAWERFAKAHELAPTIKPHRYQPDCWLVPSASRDGDYAVRIDHATGHHRCSCPDIAGQTADGCKHTLAVTAHTLAQAIQLHPLEIGYHLLHATRLDLISKAWTAAQASSWPEVEYLMARIKTLAFCILHLHHLSLTAIPNKGATDAPAASA